jgi:hypothetical protein
VARSSNRQPAALLEPAIDALGYDGVISAEVLSNTLREQAPAEGARVLMESLRTHWPIS